MVGYVVLLQILLSISGLEAVPLLMSWTSSIKLVDDTDPSNISSVATTPAAIALDFHFQRGEYYFSDGTGTISRGSLRSYSPDSEPVVIAEVKLCDGLAVDWVHNNLYWTDISRHTVETANLDGLHRSILFNSSHGVEKPRAIALDPSEGSTVATYPVKREDAEFFSIV